MSQEFWYSSEAEALILPNLRIMPLEEVNVGWSSWRHSDFFYPEMIPEPDYSESDDEDVGHSFSEDEEPEEESEYEAGVSDERLRDVEEENENEDDVRRRTQIPSDLVWPDRLGESLSTFRSETSPRLKKSQSLEEGLIMPKKPTNPYMESIERRRLHSELKFNQKYGKSGNNQKSELQKALEKYTESKIKRDAAASRRTSLEIILEQQARKLEQQEKDGPLHKRPSWIERLQRQHIPPLSDPETEEFYRVHARVVSNLMNNFSPLEDGSQSSNESSSKPHDSSSHSEGEY